MEKYSVLIVEDDREIREGIAIFLRGQGYDTVQAGNGEEGLAALGAHPVHLAIVDIMMPVMDGITMVMRLREAGGETMNQQEENKPVRALPEHEEEKMEKRKKHVPPWLFAVGFSAAAAVFLTLVSIPLRSRYGSIYEVYQGRYTAAVFLVLVLILLLPRFSDADPAESRLSRLPAGLIAAEFLFAEPLLIRWLKNLAFRTLYYTGGYMATSYQGILKMIQRLILDPFFNLDIMQAGFVSVLIAQVAACFLALILWIVLIFSLRRMVSIGFSAALREQTICGWFVRWMQRTVERIRFTGRETWTLLRLVALQTALIAGILALGSLYEWRWTYFVLLLVLYSAALFIGANQCLKNVGRWYGNIRSGLHAMADGRLDAEIPADTGLFSPLREEMERIQAGFKRAVENEVRSRNVKTELITNVSHDLKTPLTAIITYVKLLKEEETTEEERKEYLDILDQRSQRLKTLIEDLICPLSSRQVKYLKSSGSEHLQFSLKCRCFSMHTIFLYIFLFVCFSE